MNTLPETVQNIWNILFPFAIGINLMWYISKVVLRKNSYEISWFNNHWQDIGNMIDLAKRTTNHPLKILYFLIPIAIVCSIPAMFFILIFLSNK